MNTNLGISTCYDSGMNTTTNHQQYFCRNCDSVPATTIHHYAGSLCQKCAALQTELEDQEEVSWLLSFNDADELCPHCEETWCDASCEDQDN